MTTNELRAFINGTFGANGIGDIDGNELRTALLEFCDRIDANSSWQPIFQLVNNGVITGLKVADWTSGQGVKPPTGLYIGANGFVADINAAVNLRGVPGSPGLPGSAFITTVTGTTDGLAATRYYPLVQFGSGGSDFAQVELIAHPLETGVHQPIHISLYMAVRGGVKFEWTSIGPLDQNIGLVACTELNGGLCTIYAKSHNNFITLAARVPSYFYSIGQLYTSFVGQNTIPGTLVFDSAQPTFYKPLRQSSLTQTAYLGFLQSQGLLTTGPLPSIFRGAALGSGSAAMVANSTDASGAVSMSVGSNPVGTNPLATVSFSGGLWPKSPLVHLTPANPGAAANYGRVYVIGSTGGFTIYATENAVDANSVLEYSYLVVA